jgi:hypothetical protein
MRARAQSDRVEHAELVVMARVIKAEREREAKMKAAFDAGFDYHREHADESMTAVHRVASARYTDKSEAIEFAYGYAAARHARDEHLREKNELR